LRPAHISLELKTIKGRFQEKLLKNNLKIIKSKRQRAKTLIEIASINLLNHDTIKSLSNLNEALKVLLPEFMPKSIFDLPNKNQFYPENTIKEALDAKAVLLEGLKKYQMAIACYKNSFVVEDLLRNTYISQKSKILQQIENRARSEKLVDLYDALYLHNKKDSITIKMLESIEYSKARVLSNNIKKEFNYQLIKKDSIYQDYLNLKQEIANIDNKIQQESLKNSSDLKLLEKLNKQKALLNTDFVVLKKSISLKYPFLGDTQFKFDFNKIRNELLADDQEIIYFFNTSKYLYVFTITLANVTYNKIVKTPNFVAILQNYISFFVNGSPDKIANDISNYKSKAFKLYKLFFNAENNKNKLCTIIPDQELNFLPFDALLTKKSISNNFENLPYLVNDKTINYGYSLTILSQLKQKSINKSLRNVIGFFPLFLNNHRNNKTLEYTIDEKNRISAYFDGIYLESEKANKENFLKNSSTYDIIHVSTHASAGDRGHPAQIEFYDKTLYLPEIYGLQFQSNLMVLSACETGIGKLEKGEGAMSLSRGFTYAGIPNLVVSLWKVNDKSTSILIGDFSKHLKNTKSISFSLQKAKLDYLKSKKVSMYKKNPYFWSGFIFIGNTNTHSINDYNIAIYTLIVVLLIFFTIFIIKERKKH
jgi:hypothetical protein